MRPGAKPRRRAAQRELLMRAMAQAVGAKGYADSRVEDALLLSGLSRSTFYRHFGGKEDCFAAAFEWAAAGILAAAEEAVAAGGEEPAARVEAVLRATLERLAAEPGVARLVLVEARAADAACRQAQLRWLERLAGLLEAAAGDRGDASVARLTIGAISALLSARVSEAGAEGLPAILPQLVYVALTPYVGPGAADERARSEFERQIERQAGRWGRNRPRSLE